MKTERKSCQKVEIQLLRIKDPAVFVSPYPLYFSTEMIGLDRAGSEELRARWFGLMWFS